MAYLKVVEGPNRGQIWEVKGEKIILGRHPDCEIAINVADASRHHAQIVIEDKECFLDDLHSRNGTFLNDERVRRRRRLVEGDHIRIADTVYVYQGGHSLDSRKARTEPADGKPVLVEGEEDESSNLVLVSKRDASSSDVSERSVGSLQSELRALLEITRKLRKTLSLDRVLPQIIESLFLIFSPADRGFVVLERDDGELEPQWVKLRYGAAGAKVPISRTIVRRVMESQQAILSGDASDDSRFRNSESLAEVPIRSMMCAPLIDIDGNSFGVLQVDSVSDSGRFKEEDLEVLWGVANQASIAIENARLHERILQQRTIEHDLELADQIQRGFLPKGPPALPEYHFFEYYCPASHVGGDFYDYIPLADDRLAVVVADVVGHGLAAAMLTAKLAAEVRFHLLSAPGPAEAVNRLNASLAQVLRDDHFVTLALAVLEPRSGEVTVINAGHMPPQLRLPDGEIVEVGKQQADLPLGVQGDIQYESATVQVPPGALMLIFSDGINEALDDADRRYGMDRVVAHLRSPDGGATDVGARLVEDVRRFIDGCLQVDDMCLVCFGRQGQTATPTGGLENAGLAQQRVEQA